MKVILLLAALLTTFAPLYAQENLAVSQIPEELLEGADAVIRYDDTTFEVETIGKGKKVTSYAITIFNRKAAYHANVAIYYDKLQPVSDINATVYDANGKVIEKLKKGDISDFSDYDGFTIYSDNRIKNFDMRQNSFPYTVEVSYKTIYDGLLSLPPWIAQYPGKTAVERSSFVVATPADYELRYQTLRLDAPKIVNGTTKKFYTWTIENSKSYEEEPLSAAPYSDAKAVILAPGKCEMEGYVGDMRSWESFGRWLYKINEGRDELDDEQVAAIRKLVLNASSEREKVKLVYEYLQKNTRYVGIQLGFGGWQTFPASYVASNGYGDCKALTNYTRTMLKYVGVDSYYTLIAAGKNEEAIDPSFPMNQFNHVILSVPMEKDTIWLECTSQDAPFGYLGYSTSDRDALMLSEDGGTLVHTPVYEAEKNLYLTTGEITIDKEGNAEVSLQSDFKGLSFRYMSDFNSQSPDEQKQTVRDMFPLKNTEDLAYTYTEDKKMLPEASIAVDFKARKLASVSGKRIFLVPNQVNRMSYIPEKIEERKTDFKINYEDYLVDSITYKLPEGIYVERLPSSKKIETDFGTYEVSYEKGDGYLKYVRTYRTRKGTYDKTKYEEYTEFYKKCVRADKQKVVFAKTT